MVLEIVAGFVALAVLVLIGAYTVNAYNQLVSLRERAEQAKSNIDVLLKQRQDELEKLIDTAQEFMEQEEDVLTQVTEAREQVASAETPKEQAAADQQVKGALANFEARMEDYPELTSQKNMQQLQERISDVETNIADRREVYNEAVTELNTRIEQFPYVLLANAFGFSEKELFEAPEGATEDVDVGAAFENA